LFLQHLGATPSAVAHTRRMHFAKKLIDETSLLMSHVAQASGFGCVRRFNAAIRKTYHRTPTQIRRLAHQKETFPGNRYLFRLGFRPPYQWESMLAFLAARATAGVEEVTGGHYRRSISLNGTDGYFEVSLGQKHDALSVHIQFDDSRALFLIIERIRRMFDLGADWQAIAARLRTDPALARRVEDVPGLRVPGCWSGFELATRAILGQQITVQGATALAGRIVSAFGRPFVATGGLTHLFPSPEVLADSNLASVGLTTARAETIRTLARAVCDGRLSFEGIAESDAFLTRLCEIPGVGPWTAQYVAMRALGEPDAFPSGDLGLLRALNVEGVRELERRSEAWRPWRAYAAMYLWKIASERGTPAKRTVLSRTGKNAIRRTPDRQQVSVVA
jgi:AraC family transcriptional regulator of adaptative response / DNA-3-methyladenine glycosylase II